MEFIVKLGLDISIRCAIIVLMTLALRNAGKDLDTATEIYIRIIFEVILAIYGCIVPYIVSFG